MKLMKYSKIFITGCDSTTSWMLPWFKENLAKHNPDIVLKVYDFDIFAPESKGWFKKPAAMIDASKLASKVCWLDTDCEVRAGISEIFNYTMYNKLHMVIDQPWQTRRGEVWHNTGVVLFEHLPNILTKWNEEVKRNPKVGDQEVLHSMLNTGMNRMINVEDLPKEYNTLRLDLIDNTAPKNIKIMHWTGAKGKEEIKRQMNG